MKNGMIDLTVIRSRFAPERQLTALEEWRRIELKQRRKEWLRVVLAALIVGLAVGFWVRFL